MKRDFSGVEPYTKPELEWYKSIDPLEELDYELGLPTGTLNARYDPDSETFYLKFIGRDGDDRVAHFRQSEGTACDTEEDKVILLSYTHHVSATPGLPDELKFGLEKLCMGLVTVVPIDLSEESRLPEETEDDKEAYTPTMIDYFLGYVDAE